jgi:alkanesulfonate monooxygenase SsuD/methylene tetrahydromethanopterin reductase-like flavin-dependent oxidoreductase (luciferase family)
VEYFVVYNSDSSPQTWAQQREAEGWDGVAMADHVDYGGRGWWHPFSTLGAMAARTDRVQLTTAYANNLIRSPVEVAQAALSLHALSAGRFEVGLGAGWADQEIIGSSLDYPGPRERAERFREAVLVVRDLLTGPCAFQGDHYQIDLQTIGPLSDPPPRLGAALGGPWTTHHIGPLLDHIEVAPMGPAIRGGNLDPVVLAATTTDDVHRSIHRARESNSDADVGLSVFMAVGDGPMVDRMNGVFGDGFASGLAGTPPEVAEAVHALGQYDVDRVTLVPSVPGSIEVLAPALLS